MSKVKVRFLVNGYKMPRGTEVEVDPKIAERLVAGGHAQRIKAAPKSDKKD